MSNMTVGEAINRSGEWLGKRGIERPKLDAELLLAHILSCDRLRLYMDWQKPLTDLEIAAYRDFIARRGKDNEPVARIIGYREFYGRRFEVTRDTFVPRPETEGLVERALTLLAGEAALQGSRHTILEVGTGTGCIIVSIAAQADAHEYIATDVSEAALAVAARNAKRHGVAGRVSFRHGAGLAGYQGTLGLLVSNPPYIRNEEEADLPPDVRNFDPREALYGGADGLDVVRVLAQEAARLLTHGGWALLEIGNEQGAPARQIFEQTAAFDRVKVEKDLAGLDRYVMARRGE